MGFFSRLGKRLSGGLHAGARLGKKILGQVHRVGKQISETGEKVLNTVDRIPVIGQMVSPISGVIRSGIGLVKDVSAGAKAGIDLIDKGESMLTAGEEAFKSKLEKGSGAVKSAVAESRENVKVAGRMIRG
jgi:hypothetical protein